MQPILLHTSLTCVAVWWARSTVRNVHKLIDQGVCVQVHCGRKKLGSLATLLPLLLFSKRAPTTRSTPHAPLDPPCGPYRDIKHCHHGGQRSIHDPAGLMMVSCVQGALPFHPRRPASVQ